MSGSNAKPRVAIVGAGLTGLLVAQGLKKVNSCCARLHHRHKPHAPLWPHSL